MASQYENGIVLSGDVSRGGHRKRKIIYAALALAGVVALVGAGAWYVHSRKSPTVVSQSEQSGPNDTVSDIATEYATAGKYTEAQDILDDNLATAKNATERGRLYETKSLIAYNAGQYQDALTLAHQAETLHANRNTSYLIAIAAEAIGDKEQAIKYYQTTADRTTTYEKDEYLKKVQELRG